MATDPVCGMTVEEGPGALRLQRENRTYYFCSSSCLSSFAAPEASRKRLAHRLAVGWPIAIATAALVWVPTFRAEGWVAAVLAGIVQFYAGAGFYVGAGDALRQRVGNMDLLIATGTSAAFGFSVAVLLLPGRLPPTTYFDASALIVMVILTGSYLEALTRRAAGSAVRSLGELLPTLVTVTEGATDRRLPISDVIRGMECRVGPGERAPVDGTVVLGRSTADEAILTGEATPVPKQPGATVLAGSRNLDGPLVVRVERVGPDTFLSQVGSLLEEAELERVPLQQRADRLAAVFAPFAIGLGIAAGALWWFWTGGSTPVAILVFVTVVVTACPCAFGLATPAAILVGTGRAAEDGILFRGGDAIERASRIDTVLTDKTGTLTEATLALTAIAVAEPTTPESALSLATGLEAGVDHPISRALVEAAAQRGVTPSPLEEVRLEPGIGVSGRSEGRFVSFGRTPEGELPAGPLADAARRANGEGSSWAVLAHEGRPVAVLVFRSRLRPEAAAAIGELREEGLTVALVTGDHEAAARSVAREAGISQVFAAESPAGKVALVRRYQADGHRVAFVGDGVNDAPALAAADLGIAVGTGAEVAREAGQVLLVRPDLTGVPEALRSARRIVDRVRANLLWALGYNSVLLPIAAGVLVPLFGLGVYRELPILGAVAMGLSSTTVLLGSLALRRPAPRPRAGPPLPVRRTEA